MPLHITAPCAMPFAPCQKRYTVLSVSVHKVSGKGVNGMKYAKPKLLAKNAPAGGYAAGCPAKNSYQCKTCFRQ